jgi:hypothetical protein
VLPVACYSCAHARKYALEGTTSGARDGGQIHGWNENSWIEAYDNEAVAICGSMQPYGWYTSASDTGTRNLNQEITIRDFGAEEAIYWIVRGNLNVVPSGEEIGNQGHELDGEANNEATMLGNEEKFQQKDSGKDRQRKEMYLDYALGGLFPDN